MTIEYNNGEKQRLITGVLHILVIDGENPVTVLLDNGKELTIRLDHIEAIIDDSLIDAAIDEEANTDES